MAHKNGCNTGQLGKPSGSYSKRMDPASFARNNLAKGGVNSDLKPGPQSTGTAKRMKGGAK